MESRAIIKSAIRLGNSSGVILPKDWESRKVRVELVEDSINRDVLEILSKKGLLREVMGIYLVGSYARGEEEVDSDIDVLIVTKNMNKNLEIGNYGIVFISKEKLEKNLGKSLYLYSLVREAKPILNNSLIEDLKNKEIDLDVRKLIIDIRSIVKLNKESANLDDETEESARDGLAYSVVLRFRELYMIDCIIKNKEYKKRDFIKIINDSGATDSYEAYLRVKNNLKTKNDVRIKGIKRLLENSQILIDKIEDGKKRKKT